MSEILNTKIKENGLLEKSDISNVIKISDLNAKLTTLATKAKLKAEHDKLLILQGFDLIYFGKDRKNFFGKDGFQNVFFYQVTLVNVNTLVLKEAKGTEYFIA